MRNSYYNSEPYVPKGMGELRDLLASMILGAPNFRDKSGYFPDRGAESEFFALNEALKRIRDKIGEDNYQKAIELSARARVHFAADPEDKSDDGIKGRDCLLDIETILKSARPRRR